MNDDAPLLRVRDISKIFGATTALHDVTLEVRQGEILSLLGRNGAGKSTLVNIIAGIYPPSGGDVEFEGTDIRDLNIFQRQELGIRLVPQHENSFGLLTVAENIFVGQLPRKNGLIDWATMESEAAKELERYGLAVSPRDKVSELSSIDARKLNIIRAMHSGAKLIILDEPTTALTNKEREELFSFVRDLKAQGTAFIFISHYLGEVLELSDQIVVLRDGTMFPAGDVSEASEKHLASLVAGGEVELLHRTGRELAAERPVRLSVRGLCSEGLNGVDLDIYQGEILGVVGFPRSGAREFCRTLFGVNKATAGTIDLQGQRLNLRSPGEAIAKGLAYISFDRHREGIIPSFDINENIGVSIIPSRLKKAFGLLDLGLQRSRSNAWRDELKIKSNSIDEPIESLSGGNQQKVLISRLLNTEPKLLILDEPTIGIDIQSREEIITKVDELCSAGLSAIYLTNDYEELLRVADRLAIFDHGEIVHLLDNKDLTIEQLTALRDDAKEAVS